MCQNMRGRGLGAGEDEGKWWEGCRNLTDRAE